MAQDLSPSIPSNQKCLLDQTHQSKPSILAIHKRSQFPSKSIQSSYIESEQTNYKVKFPNSNSIIISKNRLNRLKNTINEQRNKRQPQQHTEIKQNTFKILNQDPLQNKNNQYPLQQNNQKLQNKQNLQTNFNLSNDQTLLNDQDLQEDQNIQTIQIHQNNLNEKILLLKYMNKLKIIQRKQSKLSKQSNSILLKISSIVILILIFFMILLKTFFFFSNQLVGTVIQSFKTQLFDPSITFDEMQLQIMYIQQGCFILTTILLFLFIILCTIMVNKFYMKKIKIYRRNKRVINELKQKKLCINEKLKNISLIDSVHQ